MGTDVHAAFFRRKTPLPKNNVTDVETETPVAKQEILAPQTENDAVYIPPYDFGKFSDWEMVPCSWEQDRCYLLFAFLADVRNGFGFAGIFTHKPVEPISEPRGLPSEFPEIADGTYEFPKAVTLDGKGNPIPDTLSRWDRDDYVWFGDHSFSWLTIDEILDWYKNKMPKTIPQAGIVNRDFFMQWDGVTEPDGWCGGVSGQGVVVVEWDGKWLPAKSLTGSSGEPGDTKMLTIENKQLTADWTHIRIYWHRSVEDSVDNFIEGIKGLKEEYPNDDLLMIFGFDS